MPTHDTVTVYSFLVPDLAYLDDGGGRVSSFKATRDAIIKQHGGHVLEGTAQPVGRDELDAQGRYQRVATGWGDLDPAA